MPKIDLNKVPVKTGSTYPEPYASQMKGRSSLRLGEGAGLTQFGANLVIMAPGAVSSVRHWHQNEDEFVMVTQGELHLQEDEGETLMTAGEFAAFPAGVPNGHRFVNRSDAEARFLVIGTKAPTEVCTYSDVDMMINQVNGRGVFTRKDGSPMPEGDTGA